LHILDQYGSDLSYSGEIRARQRDLNGDHGTEVANLVLGGTAIRERFMTRLAQAPIRLRVYNISHLASEYTLSIMAPGEGIRYLGQQNVPLPIRANIINISLEQSSPEGDLNTVIPSLSGSLFVVAAGNGRRADEGGGPRDLGSQAVYPAAYGGPTSPNIVTVTARASISRRQGVSSRQSIALMNRSWSTVRRSLRRSSLSRLRSYGRSRRARILRLGA
ncbi:MAG: S8 family serine peptidase, partial [Terricaulis sp.]